jgi:anaerobic magnesium-protoporphyrin IX monomethyl ester cyclase
MGLVNVLLLEMNPFVPASTPISIGYIASFLKSKGFGVRVMALGQDTPASRASLSALVRDFQPALVGLTVYQRTMLYVTGLARLVKSVDTDIKVAIGGPQATFMPSSAFADLPDVDYICRSSGEVTVLNIAEAIQDGSPFSNVLGASYRDDDGTVHDTESIDGFTDLDAYPSPYLDDIFDYERMSEAIMLTSRGCPHNCLYCYTPPAFNHKVHFHSVDRVMEEIRWIKKQGVKRLWFADPNISFKPNRLNELVDRILGEGLESEMWLQTRADLVTPGLMEQMRQAGVSTIAFGLESASERVLSKLDKKVSIHTVADAIRMAQAEDIEVELFTMFGLPYETFEDAVKTLEFVKENNVKIMGNTNSQQMQIYFGTPMARDYADYNIRPLNEDRPAYLSIGSQYETDHMTHDEIQEVQELWKANSLDGGKRIVS